MNEQISRGISVKELLARAARMLQFKGIESSSLISELLICHVLHCDRNDLIRKREQILSGKEVETFYAFIDRASQSEPVQYIIGECVFMGLPLFVNPHVLITRSETEILVEKVIELSKAIDGTIRILDIGTGSGNIAISLSKFIPGARIDAIDLRQEALSVAKCNIERHGVGDTVKAFLHDVFDSPEKLNSPYNIIVSNPPYVSTKEYQMLSRNVRDYEPEIALTDGGDGLRFYRRISDIANLLLSEQGLIAVEVGYDQSQSVRTIFEGAGYREVTITPDYSGIDRVISAKTKSKQ